MPSTESGKDLYLILTTIMAGLPPQLWLLFVHTAGLSFPKEMGRECADQQTPCFPLRLCSGLAGGRVGNA